MIKYYQWSLSLNNIRYSLTKIDIILFSTLAFNKKTIVGNIEVL